MNNITAVIKSFLRNNKTRACIDSLLKTYPGIKVIVIDDSYPEYRAEMDSYYNDLKKKGHQVIYAPFDIGISAGRNWALENITTEYTLIGDNDFIYTKEAGVDRMKEVLESRKDIDVVCGGIIEEGNKLFYEGFMKRGVDDAQKGFLKYTLLDHKSCLWEHVKKNRITRIDIGFNYFLMRTSMYPQTFWCPDIKIKCEHSDFFLRLQNHGRRCVYLEDAFAINDASFEDNHPDYGKFRGRKNDCATFGKNWKLDYAIGFDNDIAYLENI